MYCMLYISGEISNISPLYITERKTADGKYPLMLLMRWRYFIHSFILFVSDTKSIDKNDTTNNLIN